ncbi:MAG: hypothetical protein MUF42_13265 [Cytophagaceae bacterium]|jgi:hypothetical protein|nr:hypothetical protein [Cytophagaceae bacterium]
MKKTIVSLLIITLLTACKKDNVKPLMEVQDTGLNRLPKKIEGQGLHKEFLYNSDNTLRLMIRKDPSDDKILDSVFYFYNNGKLIRKFTKGIFLGKNKWYTYDHLNRLTSIDNGTLRSTFNYNNAGKVDYVLRFNNGIQRDSIAVDGSQITEFLFKGELNSITKRSEFGYAYRKKTHYYFTANGPYYDPGEKNFNDDTYEWSYVYGKDEMGAVTTSGNDIEFQYELAKEIVRIGEINSEETNDILFAIHNKLTPYKYCLKARDYSAEYQFDHNTRLILIKATIIEYTSTGSPIGKLKTYKITY